MTRATALAAGRGLSSGWEGGHGTLECLWTSPRRRGEKGKGSTDPLREAKQPAGERKGGPKVRGKPPEIQPPPGKGPPHLRPPLRARPGMLPGRLRSPRSGLPSRDALVSGGDGKVRPPTPSIRSPSEGALGPPRSLGGAAPCLRSPHPGL